VGLQSTSGSSGILKKKEKRKKRRWRNHWNHTVGSMVLLYIVLHGSHQYTPFMLAYIPAPWIRHGL
jgi:hypothetical protein